MRRSFFKLQTAYKCRFVGPCPLSTYHPWAALLFFCSTKANLIRIWENISRRRPPFRDGSYTHVLAFFFLAFLAVGLIITSIIPSMFNVVTGKNVLQAQQVRRGQLEHRSCLAVSLCLESRFTVHVRGWLQHITKGAYPELERPARDGLLRIEEPANGE